MKKNENILKYIEKYKDKYNIKFAEKGSKFVRRLDVISVVLWVYSFFWIAVSILSFSMNFAVGVQSFSDFKKVFLLTVASGVLMIGAAVMYVYDKKIIELALALAAQPLLVFAYEPISKEGMGYIPKFYFAYLIPAIVITLFALFYLFIIIRAIIKNNKLYNQIIYDLYNQYGTRDGEKLDEEQWQEFLDNFDPTKINDLNKEDE